MWYNDALYRNHYLNGEMKLKTILIVMIALLLFGCENESEHIEGIYSYGGASPTRCLNGVVYYQFANQMAPAFGTDSKVILCDQKEK